jgi:hypothetical protein
MPIEDLSRFKSEKTPVLIEETYELLGNTPSKVEEEKSDSIDEESCESHLFILVHGF